MSASANASSISSMFFSRPKRPTASTICSCGATPSRARSASLRRPFAKRATSMPVGTIATRRATPSSRRCSLHRARRDDDRIGCVSVRARQRRHRGARRARFEGNVMRVRFELRVIREHETESPASRLPCSERTRHERRVSVNDRQRAAAARKYGTVRRYAVRLGNGKDGTRTTLPVVSEELRHARRDDRGGVTTRTAATAPARRQTRRFRFESADNIP